MSRYIGVSLFTVLYGAFAIAVAAAKRNPILQSVAVNETAWIIENILPQTPPLRHLALFPHTGLFGHDVLMRQVGEDFNAAAGWRVSWLQARLSNFEFGPIQLPDGWQNVVMSRAGDYDDLIRELYELTWQVVIPFDPRRLWDVRAARAFFEIIWQGNKICADFLRTSQFREFLRAAERHPVELVVVDHLVNECAVMAASALNTTTVQFSNWPIADRYVSALNVPTNPAYVPATTTSFDGRRAMTFASRLSNTFFLLFLYGERLLQSVAVPRILADLRLSETDLMAVEASHLLYAGRSEFLFDVVRPTSNRIKHFGCTYCRSSTEYLIQRPLRGAPATVQERRYVKVQREFPAFDLALLDRQPFILVSFGSIAKVELMPDELLDRFLDAFSAAGHLNIVWQTNGEGTSVLRGRRLPPNLHLHRWLPVRVMLSHPNIRYAILHGGINTINEMLMFGVPVLGIPNQGDQPSNLKRLVELGVGEMALLSDVRAGTLGQWMHRLEDDRPRYTARARLVASMANFYRAALRPRDAASLQHFWLRWAARHGARLRASPAIFRMRYRSYVDFYAIAEINAIAMTIFGILLFLYK